MTRTVDRDADHTIVTFEVYQSHGLVRKIICSAYTPLNIFERWPFFFYNRRAGLPYSARIF